jgi:hypothetical protein
VVVDVLGEAREQGLRGFGRGTAECYDIHRHIVLLEKFRYGLYGDMECLFSRIAEDAGGDERERNALAVVFLGEGETLPVAGDELFPLAAGAAVPHGADRVDDIPARQTVALRDLRIARAAAAERAAFGQQFRPRGAVDAPVHSPAAEERFLRGVDDGVHGHGRNIVSYNLQRHSDPASRKVKFLSAGLYCDFSFLPVNVIIAWFSDDFHFDICPGLIF